MATKTLAILLAAKNSASGPIKAVKKDVDSLGASVKRSSGMIAKGVGVGATAAVVGLGIAIKSGLNSLAEREDVISATAAAIKATGSAAHVAGPEVRQWSEEIEHATNAAVDDKAIQDAANTLLRFTQIGHDNFKRTLEAATDLGAAMKSGPQAAAKLLGKALADPVKAMGALRKAGIVLSKADEHRIKILMKHNKLQQAQAFILGKVEERYKGAAAASAGPYQTALNKLADASEDAKMALATGFLPVIERVADFMSEQLAKPEVMAEIKSFGESIAGLFDEAITFAQDIPWDSIKDAMRVMGQGSKAALDMFNGAPAWLKTAILTGWGLNKITGGAVGDIVGSLGSGLIKGVLGMNAGVVNINAGVVNGAGGGVPGGGGGGGGVKSLVKTALSAALPIAAGIGAGALVAGNQGKVFNQPGADPGQIHRDLTDGKLLFNGRVFLPVTQATQVAQNATTQGLDTVSGVTRTGLAGVMSSVAAGAAQMASAVAANRPYVYTNVVVNVTASSVTKSVSTQNKIGNGNGSRGSGGTAGGGGAAGRIPS